jgi:hypothetical protein
LLSAEILHQGSNHLSRDQGKGSMIFPSLCIIDSYQESYTEFLPVNFRASTHF